MKRRTVLGTLLTLALATTAMAQQEKLKIGDAAPALDVSTWVKGDKVNLEPGQVYIVEFWATWCAPCRKSIPHLTQLQKQYADDGLTIIGVSTDSETEKVEPFVRGQGDQMAYTVAIDNQGNTERGWMGAAGKNGIPCAFIIDRKGKLAWIGNPHPQANEGFEETLKQVMTGRFDPKLSKRAEPLLRAARNAKKLNNWSLASKHYEEVMAMDNSVFASVALEKFEMLLLNKNDRKAAYDYARNDLMNGKFASDAGALQMLAEKIATDTKIDHALRDMDLALEVAEAAQRLAGNDAKALAMVATVRYQRGEIDQAIEVQKQAYFAASPRSKPQYKRALTAYQEAAQRSSMSSGRSK